MGHHNIKSQTGRRVLSPSREPYWSPLGKGVHVGFRAAKAGTGTWLGRRYKGDKRYEYQSLGSLMHVPEKLRFDHASEAAKTWAIAHAQGVLVYDATVRLACTRYIDSLRAKKGDESADAAEKNLKRLVYNTPFENILLRELSPDDIEQWFLNLKRVVKSKKPLSKSSANRYFSVLKAALNLAYDKQLCASKLAWEVVKNHKKATGQRDYFLSTKEMRDLIQASKPDLRNLIKAIVLTAGRPGEIAQAMVADFDRRNGVLSVTKGKTGKRKIILSSEATAFFTEMTKDRIGLPLIHFDNEHSPKDAEGKRNHTWSKDLWKTAFKKARKAAELPEDKGIVMYSCRHYSISQQLKSGIDIFKVAKNAGTSVEMIQKHYGHIRTEDMREALDRPTMF